jgi:2-keto-3-deoxy-L-fuconate dehydrogenase
MRLSGKVAVIAGSGTHMSRTVALLFVQEGARVYLLARTPQASEATAALAAQRGGVATYLQADLTSDEQAQAAFGRIVDEAGGIDIVGHHVGGFMSVEHDVTRLAPEFWERAYASIMRTLFLTARYAVPAMEARGGGALLTIAASYRVRQMANSAYASARDAQVGFVRNLAREVAPKNVRVHALCCGLITDHHAWEGPVTPDPRPLDRLGRPEDVAYAALYLASPSRRVASGCAWASSRPARSRASATGPGCVGSRGAGGFWCTTRTVGFTPLAPRRVPRRRRRSASSSPWPRTSPGGAAAAAPGRRPAPAPAARRAGAAARGTSRR